LVVALAIACVVTVLEQRRDALYQRAPQSGKPASRWAAPEARWMQRLEWAMADARFHWRGRRPVHPDVAIIGIDDASLRQLSQWPWSRGIHAKLIDVLAKSPPKALLFDIFFVDPFTADLRGDKALAEQTRRNPWVIHSLYCDIAGGRILAKTPPIPALARASSAIGFVNAVIDDDGVLREAIPDLPDGSGASYLLSVLGAARYLGKTPREIVSGMPRNADGHLLVDFAGPERSFPYVSYADVLSGALPASELAGKVVLVGAQATGTYDHYPTPLSKNMPGVEFHANVIDNLLKGNMLRYAGIRWTYAAIWIFAGIAGLALTRCSAWLGALLALALAGSYLGLSQWLFDRRNLSLDTAGPLLSLGWSYVAIVIYRFFTEEREKRWVKAAFGQYVSPKVLDILMDDPSKLKLVGERREMTVFFSDVAGFTSISERLNPDELVVLLNRYLSAMTEVIFEFDGYLNKYMGDGIMAFWNAPVKQADHTVRACRCALRSRDRLEKLNVELASQGLSPLKARVGINTGIMVVGNMGSQQKSDYTVMGDNVNLGSRLEGANKAFGTAIMISEFTYEEVQDAFEVRFLDRIRVPGKAKPVKTYELLCEKGALSPAWQQAIGLYHEAIELFIARSYEPARIKFLEVIRILGHDKPCETYAQRAETFTLHPPAPDWDGVFELTTK